MAYWLTLGRSIFAIALGVAIFFYPDKTRPMLGNFIGMFWIAGSLMSIRWGLAHNRSRNLTLIIGVLGAIAGLLMVSRFVVGNWVRQDLVDLLLGSIAVITGMLHMTGHLRVTKYAESSRTRSGIALGIFEVILGLVVLFTPWRESTIVNFVVAGWALIGGIILFVDSLMMRKESKAQEAAAAEGDA